MTSDQQQELREIILELKNDIERMAERQTEMNENLKKIKEAVYNPDQGLYARLRELENWKRTHSKLMWMVVSSMIGLVSAAIFTNIIN